MVLVHSWTQKKVCQTPQRCSATYDPPIVARKQSPAGAEQKRSGLDNFQRPVHLRLGRPDDWSDPVGEGAIGARCDAMSEILDDPPKVESVGADRNMRKNETE